MLFHHCMPWRWRQFFSWLAVVMLWWTSFVWQNLRPRDVCNLRSRKRSLLATSRNISVVVATKKRWDERQGSSNFQSFMVEKSKSHLEIWKIPRLLFCWVAEALHLQILGQRIRGRSQMDGSPRWSRLPHQNETTKEANSRQRKKAEENHLQLQYIVYISILLHPHLLYTVYTICRSSTFPNPLEASFFWGLPLEASPNGSASCSEAQGRFGELGESTSAMLLVKGIC